MRPIGWRYESARHALAARGIPTGRSYNARKYLYEDMGRRRGELKRLIGGGRIDLFEQGKVLAPRDAVEAFILKSTKGSIAGAMRILRYRDMKDKAIAARAPKGYAVHPDANPELHALLKEQVAEIKKIEEVLREQRETNRYDADTIREYKDKLKVLKANVLMQTMVTNVGDSKRVERYKGRVQNLLKAEGARGYALGEIEGEAEGKILKETKAAIESAEEDLENKEIAGSMTEEALRMPKRTMLIPAHVLKKKPELGVDEPMTEKQKEAEPLFKIVNRRVAANLTTPVEAGTVKLGIVGTDVPRALRLNQITLTRPMFEDVDKRVAEGKISPQEGLSEKMSYLRGVKKLLETKQSRVPFDTLVTLPTGKSTPPKSGLERIGKQYTELEWFARKRPWLVRA